MDLDGTVNDGGVQNVLGGGFAIDTILNDPGVQSVGSGGSASGVHISGGEQDVLSGGLAVDTLVEAGGAITGLQLVEAGGLASATTIGLGGVETILAGGSDSAATVGSGGSQRVFGSASDDVVESGGIQVVGSGGIVSDVIFASGTALGASGFVLGDVIDLVDLAFSGGTAATLTSGGVLVVTEGATTRMVQLDPAHNYASQTAARSRSPALSAIPERSSSPGLTRPRCCSTMSA
jgi:autotransporter passenger strand-loop-strand repeat protein